MVFKKPTAHGRNIDSSSNQYTERPNFQIKSKTSLNAVQLAPPTKTSKPSSVHPNLPRMRNTKPLTDRSSTVEPSASKSLE